MKKYITNYHKQVGVYPGDYLQCETCDKPAVEIHHIVHGRFKRSDEPENLIAVCRLCHDKAHGKGIKVRTDVDYLLGIAKYRCKN